MRKLTKVQDLTIPCNLFIIVGYENIGGVRSPIYEEKPRFFMANIKSFGGTEVIKDGKISYVDTIEVKTNYREDIETNYRIERLDTNKLYEIISIPENVDGKNVELFFKCEAVIK